jgi:hypothetical protein
MKDLKGNLDFLRGVKTKDLLRELGKRLNLRFGTIQAKFHQGEPTAYSIVDLKVTLETDSEGAT